MALAHLIIGTAFGLSSVSAGLLLGHPLSTAVALYMVAGPLGIMASAIATLLRPID